ncbi:hypothetical protein MOQ_008386 [Trypanosoma cruzi marinkellei]|uniref:Centrosomal protein CEP104 N-terminal domain-containing protein n=1 Tax=Trypanosoma cruzi marinkellei TaxID=85056 RepID=K2MZS5_TRYCR|nr:hypothetical protein MOQ_008386 [Trypanosoma cruzi marinkellei]
MEQRVPYDVVYCTSQEDAFPIDGLGHGLLPNAAAAANVTNVSMLRNCKGWQSARNAKMPQAIVLRFPGNVELTHMRILSHECKIASKVEVLLFALKGKEMEMHPPSFRTIRFTKLGAVDFNSNEQSNYRSKERKTIHMHAVAYFVKLLFHTPHRNAQNVFNQVGVYSIECHGQILSRVWCLPDKNPVIGNNKNSNGRIMSGGNFTESVRNAEQLHGVVLDSARRRQEQQEEEVVEEEKTPLRPFLHQDLHSSPYSAQRQARQQLPQSPPLTPVRDIIPHGNDIPVFRSVRILEFEEFFIRRSEDLLALKDQAVAVEDFDTAKLCRDRLNLMNRRSKRIYQIEQDKVQAIIEEDFDAAKEAKRVMDAMIERVYKDAQLPRPKPDFDQYECIGETFNENLTYKPSHSDVADDCEGRSLDKTPHDTGGRDDGADHSNSSNGTDTDNPSHKKERDCNNNNDNNDNISMNIDEYHDDDAHEEDAMPMVSKFAQRMVDMVRDTTYEIDKVDPPPEEKNDDGLPTPRIEESKLQPWERRVAQAIMAASSETDGPAELNPYVKNTREALDLLGVFGTFTTCCLFSKRFKLREAVLDVLMERMAELYQASPSAMEEALLRFLDMNGHGLQDTIPNVVAAGCAFIRMVLADEHKCLSSVLAPVVNLLPRLLCCAADSNQRVRDEALTTLTLCIKTHSLTNPTILTAVLAHPLDKERRRLPNCGPRVQVARLTVLEQLLTDGHMGLRNHTESVWGKLLRPCINHQSREVRDAAVSTITSLVQERKLLLTPKHIKMIDNTAIREQIKAVLAKANIALASGEAGDAVGTAAGAGTKSGPNTQGGKAGNGRSKPRTKRVNGDVAV